MSEIRYTKDHEYARLEGDEAVVGISDHAQRSSATSCSSRFPRSARS